MYHTVNVAFVKYFGTHTTEIEEIDGQIKIELGSKSPDLHVKDQTESEGYFTVTDVLLSENTVIMTKRVKGGVI